MSNNHPLDKYSFQKSPFSSKPKHIMSCILCDIWWYTPQIAWIRLKEIMIVFIGIVIMNSKSSHSQPLTGICGLPLTVAFIQVYPQVLQQYKSGHGACRTKSVSCRRVGRSNGSRRWSDGPHSSKAWQQDATRTASHFVRTYPSWWDHWTRGLSRRRGTVALVDI